MKSFQWKALALLAITSQVMLAGSSQAAINIIDPTGANYVAQVPLTDLVPPFPAGTVGNVKLTPATVQHLESPTVGSPFDTAFQTDSVPVNPTNPGFAGWTWTPGSDQGLNGTLTINRYTARDYGVNPNPNLATPRGGADMIATYVPGGGDPALTDLRWIQLYTDNAGPGGAERVHIDPFPNDDTLPWYYTNDEMQDLAGAGNPLALGKFEDHPSDFISTAPFSRTVQFETYLASFDANTLVATVYDGFAWGYTITVVPEPSSWIMGILGAASLFVVAVRGRRRAAIQSFN